MKTSAIANEFEEKDIELGAQYYLEDFYNYLNGNPYFEDPDLYKRFEPLLFELMVKKSGKDLEAGRKMTYCRFNENESDAYVAYVASVDGRNILRCYWCRLSDYGTSFETNRRSIMIDHLKEHLNQGKKVTALAFRLLEEDLNGKGDLVES